MIIKILFSTSVSSWSKVITFAIITYDIFLIRYTFSIWRYIISISRYTTNRFISSPTLLIAILIYCPSVFFCLLKGGVNIKNAELTYLFFAIVCDIYFLISNALCSSWLLIYDIICGVKNKIMPEGELSKRFELMMIVLIEKLIAWIWFFIAILPIYNVSNSIVNNRGLFHNKTISLFFWKELLSEL